MIEHWHFEPPLHKRPLTHHRPLQEVDKCLT